MKIGRGGDVGGQKLKREQDANEYGDGGEDANGDMDEGDRGCKWGWDFVGEIKGHLHSITSHRMHSSLQDTMMIMLIYGDDKQLDIV